MTTTYLGISATSVMETTNVSCLGVVIGCSIIVYTKLVWAKVIVLVMTFGWRNSGLARLKGILLYGYFHCLSCADALGNWLVTDVELVVRLNAQVWHYFATEYHTLHLSQSKCSQQLMVGFGSWDDPDRVVTRVECTKGTGQYVFRLVGKK